MKVLAVYYTDPVEGRQKFVIPEPTKTETEHYLWVRDHLCSVREGRRIGLFRARQVIPTKTMCLDWFLLAEAVGQIRIENEDAPHLWEEAA